MIEPLESAQPTAQQGYRAAMLGQRVDSDVQLLFAVQLPDRMEMFGFEVNEPDKADLADGIRVMQRDVVPMMEGARFVSQGAPP